MKIVTVRFYLKPQTASKLKMLAKLSNIMQPTSVIIKYKTIQKQIVKIIIESPGNQINFSYETSKKQITSVICRKPSIAH